MVLYNAMLIPTLLILFLASPVKNIKKEFVSVTIQDKTYKMEVANTKFKKSKGLMFTSFNTKQGMVFYYNNSIPTFYNKNVRFPLRVYWVSGNTIVDSSIFKKDSFKHHRPNQPIDVVVEIPLKEDFSNDLGELIGKNIDLKSL
jgi:uncharacterized membrane protein (UPF0127 family)